MKKFRKKLRLNERGQTSIFMALFISTMILLFAFTTNVGMLVHAKINLQNAADAAAYAGAAVQAHQLTSVAYLNYEMRRALKEFLFLYFVRGADAMACFPRNSGGASNCTPEAASQRYSFRIWDPRDSVGETAGGLYFPTSCLIFDSKNNYCQKLSVAGIQNFAAGGFAGIADPILDVVINTTNTIIAKKIDDCKSRTAANEQVIILWLFNTDPNYGAGETIITANSDTQDPFSTAGLDRLGYLPRMALLRARIDNFEEALNLNLATEGIDATITDSIITSIKSAATGNKTLDYFERPIQAYLSARNNLPTVSGDNGIFSDIQMTELIPSTSSIGAPSLFLKNPPILAKFNDQTAKATFANSKFDLPSDPVAAAAGQCDQSREEREIEGFPFGVVKDPRVLTYYAVRLQAQARLLFSPFGKTTGGTVTLSAYSAAKPFGSRIGKNLDPTNPQSLMVAPGQLSSADNAASQILETFPNILVADSDTSSNANGYATNAHLGYLDAALHALGPVPAFRLAGAYAPWEIGYYTPPANFQQPQDIGVFPQNPQYSAGIFNLIAPLFPVNGSPGDFSSITTRITSYLFPSDINDLTSLTNSPTITALRTTLLGPGLTSLFSFLSANKLTNNHSIPDPMLNDQPTLLAWAKANGGSHFTVAANDDSQKKQFTSWNNYKNAVGDANLPANSEMSLDTGRAGYSVRFISFAALNAGGASSNDPDTGAVNFSNPFSLLGSGAGTVQEDITKLRH